MEMQTLDLEPIRHKPGGLSIHPYFGKIDPSIVRWALAEFLSRSGCVLDPFCGSGTVLHEAVISGSNAVGWDSSPLAVMVATGKLLGVTKSEEAEIGAHISLLFRFVEQGLSGGMGRIEECEIPPMPRISRVSDWFAPNALRELAFLRQVALVSAIQMSEESQLLLKIAFSRIVTAASLQQGESTYRRVNKPDAPGRVIKLFLQSIDTVLKSAGAFSELLRKQRLQCKPGRLTIEPNGYRITFGHLFARIVCMDSRNAALAGSDRADLTVTSPPYLMSWDYGLYHKFRFYWLGFDLDGYESTEVGRHLRRKKDDVERYVSDMTSIFGSVRSAVSQGAASVFVNAPSVVYGKVVDTNELLVGCAEATGWARVATYKSLDIPGPHHGMYSSLKTRKAKAAGQSGKKEHVLVFRRE